MHLLRFFSRVVFIFNLCFLAAIIIQRIPNPPLGEFISLIVVAGYPVAFFVNLAVNICYATMFLSKRLPNEVPQWLMIFNFLFLIIQLIFLLK